MAPPVTGEDLILVVDTCADRASLALFRGSALLEERELADRAASAALLGAIRSMLAEHRVTLHALSGVGVVNGPGSFTGVRVGLALAKGLCEAASVPLAAVSRLLVLVEAAGLTHGLALLNAGRGQVFARSVEGAESREWLAEMGEIEARLAGCEVAVVSSELGATLESLGASARCVALSARHAIHAVRQCLAAGGSDLGTADANYVRNEDMIYAKAAGAETGA